MSSDILDEMEVSIEPPLKPRQVILVNDDLTWTIYDNPDHFAESYLTARLRIIKRQIEARK